MFKRIVNNFIDDNFYIELSLNKIFIHNYVSIISTGEKNVIIKCDNVKVIISGSELVITRLDKFDILINGKLDGVIYEK